MFQLLFWSNVKTKRRLKRSEILTTVRTWRTVGGSLRRRTRRRCSKRVDPGQTLGRDAVHWLGLGLPVQPVGEGEGARDLRPWRECQDAGSVLLQEMRIENTEVLQSHLVLSSAVRTRRSAGLSVMSRRVTDEDFQTFYYHFPWLNDIQQQTPHRVGGTLLPLRGMGTISEVSGVTYQTVWSSCQCIMRR